MMLPDRIPTSLQHLFGRGLCMVVSLWCKGASWPRAVPCSPSGDLLASCMMDVCGSWPGFIDLGSELAGTRFVWDLVLLAGIEDWAYWAFGRGEPWWCFSHLCPRQECTPDPHKPALSSHHLSTRIHSCW